MIGLDPVNDPQTLSAPIPFPPLPLAPRLGRQPLAGIKIGIPQTDWMSVAGESTVENGSPQSHYSPQHLAAFEALVADLKKLGATVEPFPGLNMNDTTEPNAPNPYYSSPVVLAEVLGEKISPSTALIDANRYEFNYAHGPQAFAESGVPSAASVEVLLRNYGTQLPGESARSFEASTKLYAAMPTQARVEGERRRRNWWPTTPRRSKIQRRLHADHAGRDGRRTAINSEGKSGGYGARAAATTR